MPGTTSGSLSGWITRRKNGNGAAWNKGLGKPRQLKLKLRVPWNSGLTAEGDSRVAKQAMSQLGKIVSIETRTKISIAQKGKPQTEEHIRNVKLGIANAGGAWNKGLTKETHPGIARGAKKLSITNTGRQLPEETKAKMSESSPLRGKPCSEEKKQNLREKNKGQVPWSKGLSKETDDRILSQSLKLADIWRDIDTKNTWLRKLRKAANQRPNKLEILLGELLDNVFPDEWLYTGNGLVTIGGMIPDFTNINGHKIVIEAFGDYWHRDEDPQTRIDKYFEFGYKCIVVWENEIKNNPAQVIGQIKIQVGGV